MKVLPKKTFSQHFLKDLSVVRHMLKVADLQKGETVLEIGPGKGILTQALVKAGAHVIAIELDKDLIPILKEKFKHQITLLSADALSVPVPKEPYKVIANIPYNITSPLLKYYLQQTHKPICLLWLVQKEVAQRIVAKPGQMSLLSVVCQLYAKCQICFFVPAQAFSPKPKVDSAVIRLDIDPCVPDPEKIIRLAKVGFSFKRKQLQKNLMHIKGISSQKAQSLLQTIGKEPTIRAQEMQIQDWIELASLL